MIQDNLATSASDYTRFSITAPSDPRLPGGGGYVVPGLFNVSAAGFARAAANNITDASNFGEQYQRYNGMLLNVSARLGRGLTFQGGINSGKTVQDNCAVRAKLVDLCCSFLLQRLAGGG